MPHMLRWLLATVLVLVFAPLSRAYAQDGALSMSLQPQSGPPATTVTVSGQGAAPNTSINILAAPFDDLAACRQGRDASIDATVSSDSSGRFTATVTAERSNANQAGITYLAKVAEGSPPRADSNLECFTFEAQQGGQYFPETGHTVSGRFLEYWQNNGGLAVFGYPLTDERQEDGRTVQYFERQRFELHPGNQPPYDVLLGLLGVELLEQRGVNWQTDVPPASPTPGCMYFGDTQHNVCDQTSGDGFRTYWMNHGLEFDGQTGKSYAESLALFGYPLTEAYQDTVEGQQVQVQWFERARFEWHPNNPVPYRVLLGRLGAEVLPGQQEPQPPMFDRANIYLVALGDEGQSGQPIGCGDSLVPVEVTFPPTAAPLTAALQRLFAIDDQFYGQSGLYNALYQSSLSLDSASVDNGTATINLSGQLQLGGVCDNPRVEAQIKETARQFSTVNEVVVYLNGQRLEDVLSEQ